MKSGLQTPAFRRLMSCLMISLFCLNFAAPTIAQPSLKQGSQRPAPQMPTHQVRMNDGSKKLVEYALHFSDNPSDSELTFARVFSEPLLPMKLPPDAHENRDLAAALLAFKIRKTEEDVSAFNSFFLNHKNSRWIPSLALDLALFLTPHGYFDKAESNFQLAWTESKNGSTRNERAIANRALTELLICKRRFGDVAGLKKLLTIAKTRTLLGSDEQRFHGAGESLWYMTHRVDRGFRCGPTALACLLKYTQNSPSNNSVIENAGSGPNGTSLAENLALAQKVGLNYQAAKRSKGSAFITPAVMHWKQQHFGALFSDVDGFFRLRDNTHGRDGNLRLSANALEAESDGYFLVPAGPLPAGWSKVSIKEAGTIWGKAVLAGNADGIETPAAPKIALVQGGAGSSKAKSRGSKSHPICHGMASLSAFTMQANTNIQDDPLGYVPPVGEPITFHLNYNWREPNQSSTPMVPNFGPNWNFNWVSFLTADSTTNGNLTVNVRGGGTETFKYNNATTPYFNDQYSQALMVQTSTYSYTRQLPDGTVETFDQPDGTGRILMTSVKDPLGNSVSISYDSTFRITAITDAIGQASTVTYASNSTMDPNAYYKIVQLSDPFSRTCSFTYDSGSAPEYLVSIQDVLNMKSQFTYAGGSPVTGPTSFISQMNTPYGTTSIFAYNPTYGPEPVVPGRGLRFTFPDGSTAVLLSFTGYTGQSYYFDRETMARYPNEPDNPVWTPPDYTAPAFTHCVTTQWLGQSGTNETSGIENYVKMPLENQTTYTYAYQTTGLFGYPYIQTGVPAINMPTKVSRIVSGTTTQDWNYTYNIFGLTTSSTDPIGRAFSFAYDSNNIDLTQITETQAGDSFVLGAWTYNTHHSPLTFIDASGYETDFTYYSAYNQLHTVTDAAGSVTTCTYDSNGYLTQIDGPLPGIADVTTFAYDGYGRLYSVTDSEGYTVSFNYDAMDRVVQVSYPDGTNELISYSRLDAVQVQDRIGRCTTSTFDSLDQLSYEVDPLGRKTSYCWCACGALRTLTDAQGNKTNWEHDLEGRIVAKTLADCTSTQFEYDVVGRLSTVTDAISPTPQIKTYSYNLDDSLAQVSYTNAINPTSNVNYTYDAKFPRVSTIGNGWGTLTYSYNAYSTSPATSPTPGRGRLSSISNGGVIASSDISFSYDNLGRTTNRTIGSANSQSWTYDAMSRVLSETNPLCPSTTSFAYTYVDDTTGSSKGSSRLASVGYPNSQTTNFSYYGNLGDQRLNQIINLNSSGTLSQFNYAYNAAGEITQRQQQQKVSGTLQNTHQTLEYDLASQLISAPNDSGSTFSAFISGTPHVGDVVSITAYDASLTSSTPVGQLTASYTVQSGDTSAAVAAGLVHNSSNTGINDVFTSALAVSSPTPSSSLITINTSSNHTTQFTSSVTGTSATDTIALSGGTPYSDLHKQLYYTYDLAGNRIGVEGDSSGSLSTGLTTNAIQYSYNCVNELKRVSAGGPIRFQGSSVNPISSAQVDINQTATIGGGTSVAGDKLWIIIHNKSLPQEEPVLFTVANNGDSPTTIALGMKNAINADTTLNTLGISATQSGSVITLTSKSQNATTYAQNVTQGAETILLGTSASAQAIVSPTQNFVASPVLAGDDTSGTVNTATITALSGGGTLGTTPASPNPPYAVTINSAPTQALSYDNNGNMLSDGNNTYAWDCENRLIQITYPGTGNNSQFSYDALGRCVEIVETSAGTVSSTRQFVWCGAERCEIRDASGAITAQLFALGEVTGGTKYYYERTIDDTPAGVTDASGAEISSISYDPFGNSTLLSGSFTPNIGFAGMYQHTPSLLNLTLYRQYSPSLGRWLSRDPIEESGGVNLYAYCENNPISGLDPLGLAPTPGPIHNWTTGKTFHLNQGNSKYGIQHIQERHGPGTCPKDNTKPRGVFTSKAWEPHYQDNGMQMVLGAVPGSPHVAVDHQQSTKNGVTKYRDVYTANLGIVTRDGQTGQEVSRQPIGVVIGPNGAPPVPTFTITIVVDPTTGEVITSYPSTPLPGYAQEIP